MLNYLNLFDRALFTITSGILLTIGNTTTIVTEFNEAGLFGTFLGVWAQVIKLLCLCHNLFVF